jgi:hypothetical protein
MSVKNSDFADLIACTLNDLPKQEFEVQWTNQSYEFCRIYQKERTVIDGGNQIERKVMLDHSGNAHYVRAYQTEEPKVADVMSTIKVGWTRLRTSYSWEKFEILQNKNSAKGFISLMKIRRIDGLWSLADLIEERAWKTPTNANDDLYPNGVPYYLRMFNAAGSINSTAGFVGATAVFQDATTTTNISGIDAATETKWRNYAATYTQVDNALLKAFRTAFVYTSFKAPLIVNDPSNPSSMAKRIYCDFDNYVQLQDLADKRDDKVTGKELLGNIRMDDTGMVTINRLPVVPIPQLNGASYTPIYCVDFSKFQPFVHDGYWMEESEPMTDRGQPETFTVYLNGAHNNLCLNARTAGFVIHKTS